MTSAAAIPPNARLLNEHQVAEIVGVSPRTIRTMVSAGRFPKPMRLGDDERHSPKRWDRIEVDGWIDERLRERA